MALGVFAVSTLFAFDAASEPLGCRSNNDCGEDQVCLYAPGCDQVQGVCLSGAFAPRIALCGCNGKSVFEVPGHPYRAAGPCNGDTGFEEGLKAEHPEGPGASKPPPLPSRSSEPMAGWPVRVMSPVACVGQEIDLRPLEGQQFTSLPASLSVFFPPCSLEGKVLLRTEDLIRVRVPEGAVTGCVWLGESSSPEGKVQREALAEQCLGPPVSRPARGLLRESPSPPVTPWEVPTAYLLPEGRFGRCEVACAQVCARGEGAQPLGRLEVLRPPDIEYFRIRGAWPQVKPGQHWTWLDQVPQTPSVVAEWKVSESFDTRVTFETRGNEPETVPFSGAQPRASGEWLALTATNRCGTDRHELQLNPGPALAFQEVKVRLGQGKGKVLNLRLSAPAPEDLPVHLSASSPGLLLPETVTIKKGTLDARVPARLRETLVSSQTSQQFQVLAQILQSDSPTAGPAPASATLDVETEPESLGFADTHNHQFANLAFGGAFVGKPLEELPSALQRCDAAHGQNGRVDIFSAVLLERKPGHSTSGPQSFEGWPSWDSVTHQAVYKQWLERAWRGGLRLMVMLAVNNELVCKSFHVLRPFAPHQSCPDMESVKRQLDGARQLQQEIDAVSGGAGQGWYRIVRTSDEARKVIQAGKLAVVLGVEVDFLLDCHHPSERGRKCSPASVTAEIEKLKQQGVRHVFPIHFATNGFGGSAQYQPLTSVAGSVQEGLRDCGGERYAYDRYRLKSMGHPVCNAEGLTGLGQHLVRELMRLGLVIDINHMSALSVRDTLALTQPRGYPVIAGHTGFVEPDFGMGRHEGNLQPDQLRLIQGSGGMVGVITEQDHVTGLPPGCQHTSFSFAQAYRYALQKMPGAPVALGTDFNGFAGEPRPLLLDCVKSGQEVKTVAYPFKLPLLPGERLDESVIGRRRYNISRDGLAHMGMLPDFIDELYVNGLTQEELLPLFRSAMGYVDLWERAEQGGKANEDRAVRTPP